MVVTLPETQSVCVLEGRRRLSSLLLGQLTHSDTLCLSGGVTLSKTLLTNPRRSKGGWAELIFLWPVKAPFVSSIMQKCWAFGYRGTWGLGGYGGKTRSKNKDVAENIDICFLSHR